MFAMSGLGKLLTQFSLTAFFFILFASASSLAADGEKKSVVNLKSDGSRHTVLVEYDNRVSYIHVYDGLMTTLSVGDSMMEFIASRDLGSKVAVLPIFREKKIHKGELVDNLRVGSPLDSSNITQEMRALGIKGMRVVHSRNKSDAQNARAKHPSMMSAGGGICMQPTMSSTCKQPTMQKIGLMKVIDQDCLEESCNLPYDPYDPFDPFDPIYDLFDPFSSANKPMYCCSFVGCNGKSGKVCSTGPVCGGDSCGGCCAP